MPIDPVPSSAGRSIEARLAAAGLPSLPRLAWLEVDLGVLAANVRSLRSLLPAGATMGVVVKADGYGTGMVAAARAALRGGRERLAQTAEPMGVASIQHCMRLLVAEVRLPKGTCPHTLRHSYATHLIEAGVSIRLLPKFMGHSSIETTPIYAHLTAVNEAHACEAAARLLDNT